MNEQTEKELVTLLKGIVDLQTDHGKNIAAIVDNQALMTEILVNHQKIIQTYFKPRKWWQF